MGHARRGTRGTRGASSAYSVRPPELTESTMAAPSTEALGDMSVWQLKKVLQEHGIPKDEYKSLFTKDKLIAKIQSVTSTKARFGHDDGKSMKTLGMSTDC